MTEHPFIPYKSLLITPEDMLSKSFAFMQLMQKRRSLRFFSEKPIPEGVLENILATAGTAPSGAHKQPWTFCVVKSAKLKHAIRVAAEKEEKLSYEQRMPAEWLEDLAPLGTDWQKPFLEIAPALIVVFKRNYELINGKKRNNYYVSESVGLASGLLLAAMHNAGLVALTHTPSPMGFLKQLLGRPDNETPFLLIPVGFAAENAVVPDIQRKKPEEFIEFYL
jgi:iodotyrosine deiodinase